MDGIYFDMYKNKMDDGWKLDQWTDGSVQMIGGCMDPWIDDGWMDDRFVNEWMDE